MAYVKCPKCGGEKHALMKCKKCGFSRRLHEPGAYSTYYTDNQDYWANTNPKDPLNRATTGGGFESNRRKH